MFKYLYLYIVIIIIFQIFKYLDKYIIDIDPLNILMNYSHIP